MLRGITSIEKGNQFLPEFIEMYNDKFSKEPINTFDANWLLDVGHDLERILCRYKERTLSKDFLFQFHKRFYKIKEGSEIKRPKGRKVEVRETRKGKMRVFWKGKELEFCLLEEVAEPLPFLSRKQVLEWEPRKTKGPAPVNYPWKKFGYQIPLSNKIRRQERNVV